MNPLNLYFGIVEDVNDTSQSGRIQVRLIPEMENATKAHLPWLHPFIAGSMDGESMEIKPINEGSSVWCFFNDQSLREGWFISGYFSDAKIDFSKITSSFSGITDFQIGNYKDLRLSRTQDGTIHFTNIETGVTGVYHNSGSYSVFDGDGNLYAYAKKKIKFYNDANSVELNETAGISIDAGSGNIQINGSADNFVTYNDLKLIFDFLLGNLDARMYIDPLSGMTGTVNPAFMSIAFDPNVQTKLVNMKADTVKTS